MLETDVAEAPVLDVAAEAPTAPELQVNDVQGGTRVRVDTHLGRYRADTKEGGAAVDSQLTEAHYARVEPAFDSNALFPFVPSASDLSNS